MPRGRPRKKREPEVAQEQEDKPLFGSAPPPPYSKGDRVIVHAGSDEEPDDFGGQVLFSKWSNQSGWWIEVKREDNELTYSMPVDFAEPETVEIDTVEVG